MPNNKRLVFDFGNQWTNNDVGSYFVLPSAWRRFLFEVLTPREVAVYLYICCITDRYAIAYPTIGQIVDDLGVRSRTTVSAAIDRIVDLHFLLAQKQTQGFLRGRKVYQRPTPHYTLRRLLSTDIDAKCQIDGELYPINRTRSDNTASTDGAVSAHLRKLLGENYFAYDYAPQCNKRIVLLKTLDLCLREIKRTPESVASQEKFARARIATLPLDLQALYEGTVESTGT